MLAYKLKHRVDIQEIVYSIDSSSGAREPIWVSILDKLEPAAINPLSGKEFIASQSIQAGITTRITIRHRDNINATMRIVHGNTIYNIIAILPDPSLKRHINLMCDSGVNNG